MINEAEHTLQDKLSLTCAGWHGRRGARATLGLEGNDQLAAGNLAVFTIV